MTFLQPWMLLALPLIALPVIIHLINQRRFRTIRWGAMMFLLAANRMSRGYARIRQWLILAARTLAIAGLLLAVSRPLASGWLSMAAGGRPDTTLILLDRSPSMQELGPGGVSKLDSAKRQLVGSLGLLGSNRWVLIDSVNNRPIEFDSLESLEELPESQPASASADLPALLQTAGDYVRENRPSRTEIWIASDVRRNDWDDESGRWQAVRDAFLELPHPVRIHLLAYPDTAEENRSIRVTNVRRVETSAGAELLLSLRVEQTGRAGRRQPPDQTVDVGAIGGLTPPRSPETIPIQIEVDGARSEVAVELIGGEAELNDHAIPLDEQQVRGWGRVSIPADSNPADNECFFVYDRPVPRKTLLVADDPNAVRPLELAAGISPDPSIETSVETLTPEQAAGADWEQAALVLWQADLPGEELAHQVYRFVHRGGQVLFFPPESPSGSEFAGMQWGEWEEEPGRRDGETAATLGIPVTGWIGDQDLLARSRSGAALPVGELRIRRYCNLVGERTALATLSGGAPLLSRTVVETDSSLRTESDMMRNEESATRHVYFCATTVSFRDSSLARDGVVLYVMVQRALTSGAAALGGTRPFVAGNVPVSSSVEWERIAGNGDVLPNEYSVQAGVYRQGDQLFAINRPEQEDRSSVVPDARVATLFDQLDFARIDATAGSGSSLLSEIWRIFLALMMAALLVEAGLCLPKVMRRSTPESPPAFNTPKIDGAAA
jgi:hypothetical protein